MVPAKLSLVPIAGNCAHHLTWQKVTADVTRLGLEVEHTGPSQGDPVCSQQGSSEAGGRQACQWVHERGQKSEGGGALSPTMLEASRSW